MNIYLFIYSVFINLLIYLAVGCPTDFRWSIQLPSKQHSSSLQIPGIFPREMLRVRIHQSSGPIDCLSSSSHSKDDRVTGVRT